MFYPLTCVYTVIKNPQSGICPDDVSLNPAVIFRREEHSRCINGGNVVVANYWTGPEWTRENGFPQISRDCFNPIR